MQLTPKLFHYFMSILKNYNSLIINQYKSTKEYVKSLWNILQYIEYRKKVIKIIIVRQMSFILSITMEHPSIALSAPYKHTLCIPRWNDVETTTETTISTSFQREKHVVCLQGPNRKVSIFKKLSSSSLLYNTTEGSI